MATSITKWILLTIVSVVIMKPQKLIHGEQQVPCAFFFGDSLFDNGNNNFRLALAKANFRPYGVDYPGGTFTGRFSNGKIIPDFIVELLGFVKPIPAFTTASGSEILRGINYASGAAGIRDDTGSQTGDRTAMKGQLFNHKTTISRMAMFRRVPTTLNSYLNKCLYTINVGHNDYLNNYLMPQYPTQLFYTPERYADDLIKEYSQQLTTLYKYGARKVAIVGLGELGCIPQQLARIPAGDKSPCVNATNYAVQLFNQRLIPLIDSLNTDLPDAKFIYINMTSISLVDPSTVGIKVINAPCCGITPVTGLCDPNKSLCSNRNEYAFWDNYHPTEALNRIAAKRMYNATLPSDTYPVDIRRLVQQ